VIAQRQMEALRAVPLTATTFTDPSGLDLSTEHDVFGRGSQPIRGVVGCPKALFNNSPVIDFTQDPAGGYGFTYTDPNDPAGAVNDVRWAVATVTNGAGAVTGRRIIVGAFRRGMKTLTYPVSLDTMVSK